MVNLGKLVALEGIDNSGKTSVANRLRVHLDDCRVPVVIYGELQSPLTPLLIQMLETGGSGFLKTYMFAMDRAWTYERKLLPSLKEGKLIIWDRYVDSAIAYRAVEFAKTRELIDLEFVKIINKPFMKPDITICIDIDAETAIRRGIRSGKPSPYGKDFLALVRQEYKNLGKEKSYLWVEGKKPFDDVAVDVEQIIRSKFEELFDGSED